MYPRSYKKPMRITSRIHELGRSLNNDLPRSEKWFQRFWKDNGLEDAGDRYNEPFRGLIPDIINHQYKYIIEVDGGIHRRTKQARLDAKKNKIYLASGYQLFRLPAFNEEQIHNLAECIERIRSPKGKTKPRVILRKTEAP
jgi:very-short-patch-repair endonuclease